MFEAERTCGQPCSLRLSETGESAAPKATWSKQQKSCKLFFFTGLSHPPGRTEWQRSLLPDFFSSSWTVDSKLAAELCSRWQSHKDKLPCRSLSDALLVRVSFHFTSTDWLRRTDFFFSFFPLGGRGSLWRRPCLSTLVRRPSMRAR